MIRVFLAVGSAVATSYLSLGMLIVTVSIIERDSIVEILTQAYEELGLMALVFLACAAVQGAASTWLAGWMKTIASYIAGGAIFAVVHVVICPVAWVVIEETVADDAAAVGILMILGAGTAAAAVALALRRRTQTAAIVAIAITLLVGPVGAGLSLLLLEVL